MSNKDFLTAGQFAKLARTTKRTVLWYDQQGILKPRHIDGDNGYRLYELHQILDFQSISLMRKLGFSIDEIKALLKEDRSMRHLFEQQRGVLEQQIGQLTRMLSDTNRYYENLQANGTLVRPELVHVPSYDIYYLYKQGPYAQLKAYHDELCDYFVALPKDTVFLTAFMKSVYEPAKAAMKIGVICTPGIRLKPGTAVQRETIPSYDALKYVHRGSTTLLSLLWQEVGKYRRKQHLRSGTGLPFADVEFYTPDTSAYPDPEDSVVTEIHMPVVKP
ncbi:MAG TPA: MerR family transcriptional regulator [Candidatus Saccharimonadales bacterium]|nr:MerR family transcriptional regulator [Candidatus Saccharimonadales bacterium]